MAPPAPVRLTTVTGWPRSFEAPSASLRASRSAALPAPNSTVSSTGFAGYTCAHAVDATARTRTATRAIRRVIGAPSRMEDDLDGVADPLLDDLETTVNFGQREGLAHQRFG